MTYALSPLDKTSAFLAAFPLASEGFEGDRADRASAAQVLWHHLHVMNGAEMMVARDARGVSVASKRGSLLVEGSSGLNLGLLRRAVRSLEGIEVEPSVDRSVSFEDPAANALWGLAERLDRVEASRVIEMTNGLSEFVIHASKGSFDLIDEPGGMDGMVDAIEQGYALDAPIEFTLGATVPEGPRSTREICEMFWRGGIAAEDGEWLFDQRGFPVSTPSGVRFSQIRSLTSYVQACVRWSGGALGASVDIYDAMDIKTLGVFVGTDGFIRVQKPSV